MSAGAVPAAGTVATRTPSLSVPAGSDPDGQPLKYWFSVATGKDGRTGTLVSSGWLPSPAWKVPPGYLRDGTTYSWTAWAGDGVDRDQGS